MPYIAQRRLKVGHDEATDSPVYREIGDEMPEAENWPWQIRDTYLREGRIREVATTTKRSPAKGKSDE